MRGKRLCLEALAKTVQEAHRPELPSRWSEIDDQLQRLARRIFEVFLDFAPVVEHAYER
jgi:hypothetical protein